MYRFASFYIEVITRLATDIWNFIVTIFKAFADILYFNIVGYINMFVEQSKTFTFLDWFMAVFVFIVNIGFLAFILIRLYQLLRKYIRFNKKEIEKETLLEEISLLSQRVVEVTSEKNKILELKMEAFGLNPNLFSEFTDDEDKEKVESRFVKLINVDDTYKNALTSVLMTEDDTINLQALVKRFIYYSASQLKLYYNEQTIAAYFAGMASSKIIILEGISGTGKTSLPYAMGKFFQHESAIISVQPSWRDRTEMTGYLNEFTKRFNESDFLMKLYESSYREEPNFIVLDEMNLARIEYYFAEFLSIMEMPNQRDWLIDIVPDTQPGDPRRLQNGKLLVSQNVWFVGTANKDDSTFTITDKVYDRAAPIEMNHRAEFVDAPYTEPINMSYDYLVGLFSEAKAVNPISPKSLDNLRKLDTFIAENFKITFGNRIMKQIRDFVPVYVASGRSEIEGLDYMVTYKILRKFESLNLPFLQDELDELLIVLDRLFGKGQFKFSIKYINDLKKQI